MNKRRVFDLCEVEQLGKRHDAGATLRQLVEEFGGSTTGVRAALQRSGRGTARRDRIELSEVDAAEVSRRYEAGETIRTLAVVFGVNTKRVLAVLRRHGVASRPFGRPWRFTQEEEVALAAEYAAGASLTFLARKHLGDVATISRAAVRGGVEMRRMGTPARWTPEFSAQVVAAHAGGETRQQLADRLGISLQWVTTQLRAAGVDVKEAHRSGPNHWNWKEGRYTNRQGYVMVIPTDDDLLVCTMKANGYVAEHRLVMGKSLGRRLTQDETVHHVNGDKTDNRTENLQLRQGNHGSGTVLSCRNCGSYDLEADPLREGDDAKSHPAKYVTQPARSRPRHP